MICIMGFLHCCLRFIDVVIVDISVAYSLVVDITVADNLVWNIKVTLYFSDSAADDVAALFSSISLFSVQNRHCNWRFLICPLSDTGD